MRNHKEIVAESMKRLGINSYIEVSDAMNIGVDSVVGSARDIRLSCPKEVLYCSKVLRDVGLEDYLSLRFKFIGHDYFTENGDKILNIISENRHPNLRIDYMLAITVFFNFAGFKLSYIDFNSSVQGLDSEVSELIEKYVLNKEVDL